MSKEHLNTPNFSLIAFDVDGTLVDGKKSTDEMVSALKRLMKHQRVVLISGSSHQALETKIVARLAQTESEFDVYSSGGTVRITYKNGEGIYDPAHAPDVMYLPSQVEEIRSLVELTVRQPHLWDVGFLEAFSKWAEKRGEGAIPRFVQGWKIKIAEPGQVDPNSAIRIEARMDPLKSRVVGVSAKSIPRELDGKETFFVSRLVERLREHFKGQFQIIPAGFASIDVNIGNGNKTRAIDHICKRLGVSPDKILYFGDEFGEHGNDRAVSNAGVTNIVDVSKSQFGLTGPELTRVLVEKIINSGGY